MDRLRSMTRSPRFLGLGIGLLAMADTAAHAAGAPLTSESGANSPWTLGIVLGILSLLPMAFLMVTAFIKISTVLNILRGAVGAPGIPTGTVVFALSLALTMLAMAPVTETVMARATPVLAADPPLPPLRLAQGVAEAVREPLREFLDQNASAKEKERFAAIARERGGDLARSDGKSLSILVPAFVISELGRAFAIGFLLYLPFLVLDLVVANVLVALGMHMLNPTPLTLPFKLLLFTAIDGWGLLAQSLVTSYRH